MDQKGTITTLNVLRLPGTGLLRLSQEGGRAFFISSDNILLISKDSLLMILEFLLENGFMEKEALMELLKDKE